MSESVPAPDSLPPSNEGSARRQEALEEENRALRKEAEAAREQKQRDDARIQQLEREKEELRRRMDRFIRLYFKGATSEKISPDQLELALQGLAPVLEEAPAPAPVVRPKVPERTRRPRRVLDDGHLEERVTVIEPEEVKADPTGWKPLGEERTAQLEYEPGRLFRHVIVRPKYVREEVFAIAPLPAQPIDKGMVGPGLLAWLLMGKFADHLPLYRMAAILHRQHGVEIPRTTLAGWVEQAGELFKLVYLAMRDGHRRRGYLQVDETPVRCLDPDAPNGIRRGYFWVYLDPGGEVLFQWSDGRAHEAPQEFLGEFRGVLQVDGYAAYETLERKRSGEVMLAHCWAHARRAIVEARAEAPRVAAWLLRQVQAMYVIEAELRRIQAGPALRSAVRSSQTRMVVDRSFTAMKQLRRRYLPGGAMAKALDYALEREAGLRRFLEDGRIEIDSNLVENAIRPCALGRKNWLFIGHPEAGERAAIFYSLMASCRLHRINPMDYLKDALSRLPGRTNREVERFTPAEWAKARRLQGTGR